jgi:N-acetylglucosamine transport system permease protein
MTHSRKPRGLNATPRLFVACITIPTIILMIVFIVYPTLQTFYLSFTNSTGISTNYRMVGLDNYRYMLFDDSSFRQSMMNTFKLMATVPPVTIVLSFILAYIITQVKLKEKPFYRTVLFFPSIISFTVIGIIFSFIYHPTVGPLNNLLKAVGLNNLAMPWLGDSKTALWAVAATLVWQSVGYYMIMIVAGIDGIPDSVFEAATIDGAGHFRKLTHITLPLVKNILGITFVLSLSGTLTLSYILSSVMTGGGPGGSSSVVLFYMYRQAFSNSNFGYAMAIAVFTLVVSFVLSRLSRFLTEKGDDIA